MRIHCIGGGPGSLYFALLAKQAIPGAEISVFERNQPDDTFGWGVVFSDETLSHFEQADAPTYAEIRRQFALWDGIDIHLGGAHVRTTGHAFAGMSRRRLLRIFHDRCRELGVRVDFGVEVDDPAALGPADLVVAADGVSSGVRERWKEVFRPAVAWGACRFAWLGTTKPLSAFTFVFRETEHGPFAVHAYPFEPALSTWIVECPEDAWRRAGLDRATEAETAAFVEALFSDHLRGHRVLAGRSVWRRFPTVSCERWRHGNTVLLGDAAHTAHFSVGSGTKLAMEDAIALVRALAAHGTVDIARTLSVYEEARRPDVARIQRAAAVSQAWFEHAGRWLRQDPGTFAFNLMTRSQRLGYAALEKRDPVLVSHARARFAQGSGPEGERAPQPAFVPLRLRGVNLANRIVVSPMCQYSAQDGLPGAWHLVHLGGFALGGAGLVMAEATAVSPEGRITPACTGLWDDRQADAWRAVTDFAHRHSGAKVGIQLAHAGRKASCSVPWEGGKALAPPRGWPVLGPCAVAWDEGYPVPRPVDRADMDRLVAAFADAAARADRAGFDVVEIHMAHGYLLSSWLSPLVNRREDEHGGSLENRLRFPLEVLDAVRSAWPAGKPVFVRISASDWMPDGSGMTDADAVEVARALAAHGCDVVDASSGGNSPASRPVYGRMYQVPFADRIRHEAGVRTMAVGGIDGVDAANTVLAAGRADLCAIARGHLLDPHLTMRGAAAAGWGGGTWPKPYLAVRPRP